MKRLTVRTKEFRRAFTALELLVVVGMLLLLAVVFAPALARTRLNSNATQCLNNMRQLSQAWVMYADDSRAKLPPNHDGGNAGKAGGSESWAGGWLDFTSNADNTNTALLVNHSSYVYGAYLGPYSRSAAIYKCPSDSSQVIIGKICPRARSVSMNGRVGDGARSWTGTSLSWLYPTVASLVAPKPSELFLFTDEREDSINDPVFQVDPDTPYQIIDVPGAYHDGAGTFGFADGHVEVHRWVDPRTVPQLVPGGYIALNYNIPADVDVLWIQRHCSAKR